MPTDIPEELDVDVTSSIDEREWYVLYPNGFVVTHSTEQAACEHQQAHRDTINAARD